LERSVRIQEARPDNAYPAISIEYLNNRFADFTIKKSVIIKKQENIPPCAPRSHVVCRAEAGISGIADQPDGREFHLEVSV
jgi:hypothetical protein